MSPMRVSSRKLVIALVSRLNDVVPSSFRLSTDGDRLRVDSHGALSSIMSVDIVEDESRNLDERLQTSVWSVISSLQDDISEDLRTPWPSRDGRTMALPQVHSDGESVHMWFGDERAPILSLPAIRIAEITAPDGANASAT